MTFAHSRAIAGLNPLSRSARAATVAVLLLAVVPAGADAQRARQGLLSLDDARIFYEVVGSTGEPIIVVHGGPGLDHSYLQPGLNALATRNTLIYYDQRGTGRSAAPLEPSTINLDAFISDIDALRQALGYERVSLLGHSFGTLLALAYAQRHQEHVRALILMNPVEPGSRFSEETAQRRREGMAEEDRQAMEELRETEGFTARDPATLSAFYRLAFRPVVADPEVVEALDLDLAAATARNGQDVARLLGESMGRVDWWDRLDSLDVPTLVLHGRYDAPPTEMARELAEALPQGTFEVLDAGHFPYVADREGLLSAVSGFFAGLR